MEEEILVESRHHNRAIARLTLNRPERRNSLSIALIERLTDAIERFADCPDTHVIIISGNGPGFCSGHDLKELSQAREQDDRGRAFFEENDGFRVPA